MQELLGGKGGRAKEWNVFTADLWNLLPQDDLMALVKKVHVKAG